MHLWELVRKSVLGLCFWRLSQQGRQLGRDGVSEVRRARRNWTPVSILETVSASHLLHTSCFDDGGDMDNNPVPFVMGFINTSDPGVGEVKGRSQRNLVLATAPHNKVSQQVSGTVCGVQQYRYSCTDVWSTKYDFLNHPHDSYCDQGQLENRKKENCGKCSPSFAMQLN